MKRILASLLIIVMLAVPIIATAADYDNHWVKDDAKYLIEKGIITPDSSGNISPDALMCRGDFVVLVNKVFGFTEKDSENFSDVAGTKYEEAFAIAKKAGYVKGNDKKEAKPLDNIVRGEVAVILTRVRKLADVPKTYAEKDVQGWAFGAVAALEKDGIMKGYEDGTFRGYNNITNAEGYALGARLHRSLPDTTIPSAPPVVTAEPVKVDIPMPTLSNEKGYMIYDTFNGITKFEDSGWKSLTVEEGNYSSLNGVFSNATPGIGTCIFGVRTSGGGTGGGMYREFPRIFQVLKSIPVEVDEKPEALPNDSVIIVEYDVNWVCDTDAKRFMTQLRGPIGVGDSTPLTSLLYQRNHGEAHLVFGSSDKQTNAQVSPNVIDETKWYRIRQEIKATNASGGYGEAVDVYFNGVKVLEDKKYSSTSGSKVGVLGLVQFSTTAWRTTIDDENGAGISVANFSVYIGSGTDKTANKGVLITAVRDAALKLNAVTDSAKVSAVNAAIEKALKVFYDFNATQETVDKELAAFSSVASTLA